MGHANSPPKTAGPFSLTKMQDLTPSQKIKAWRIGLEEARATMAGGECNPTQVAENIAHELDLDHLLDGEGEIWDIALDCCRVIEGGTILQ